PRPWPRPPVGAPTARGKPEAAPPGDRAHFSRFGGALAPAPRRYRTPAREIATLNDIEPGERIVPGSRLLVPNVEPRLEAPPEEPTVVAVPDDTLRIAGKRRVFYRVVSGDDLSLVAEFFRVRPDELLAWNRVEPTAALPEGLILQIFVDESRKLDDAVVLTDDEVRVFRVGSDEFFAYHEAQRGRVRFVHTVETGETLADVARRFGIGTGDLARINAFSRHRRLEAGERIIVYADASVAPPEDDAQE